jgi:hypothetical protein
MVNEHCGTRSDFCAMGVRKSAKVFGEMKKVRGGSGR